eukprot:2742602-Rhodomonas_salina.2
MHKTQSALLASDRSWFSYQPGYYKESQVESTGRSTYDLMVAQQKPDFQLQVRQVCAALKRLTRQCAFLHLDASKAVGYRRPSAFDSSR